MNHRLEPRQSPPAPLSPSGAGTRADCPPWCFEHHAVDDAGGHAVSHRAPAIDPHVSVSRLVRGGRVSTTIHLRPDLLTAPEARTVAAALIVAADMIDGPTP